MTRNLRRWHRTLIALLAVVLAVVFISGMLFRQSAPTNTQLPDSLRPVSAGGQP